MKSIKYLMFGITIILIMVNTIMIVIQLSSKTAEQIFNIAAKSIVELRAVSIGDDTENINESFGTAILIND